MKEYSDAWVETYETRYTHHDSLSDKGYTQVHASQPNMCDIMTGFLNKLNQLISETMWVMPGVALRQIVLFISWEVIALKMTEIFKSSNYIVMISYQKIITLFLLMFKTVWILNETR